MRPAPLLAALALVACGGDRRPSSPESSAGAALRGPDHVILRAPRTGGRVTAAIYPRLDSVVWRSADAAPALGRVLAFDTDRGVLAVADAQGLPVRVDLRLGTVRTAAKAPLAALAAGGATFFGVDGSGAVVRLTPTGGTDRWAVRTGGPVELLVPLRDGGVLAAGARAGTGRVWALRPPAAAPTDSATLPGAVRALRTGGTDRVYFAAGEALTGVQARRLEAVAPVDVGARIVAAAATPSGDRLYVATERLGEIAVVDRFAGNVGGRLELPGSVRELRMDPLGRFLLVRPARGDSAWLVAVGTDRVVGSVRGAWRDDLPLVLPDGHVAVAQGNDVALIDGATLRATRTVAGGAADFWHLVTWNGFRPRAAGLDQPATFQTGAPDAPADSLAADSLAADTLAPPPDAEPAAPDTAAAPTGGPTPVRPTVPPPVAATPRPAPRPVAAPTRVRAESAGEVALERPRTPQPPAPRATVAQAPPARGTPSPTPPASGTPAAPNGARPAAAQPPAVRPGRGFTVQFAATESEGEARRTLARLKVDGAPTRVVPTVREGRTRYRVVAGPFATRAAADAAGRASGGSYWVYPGAP